MKIFMPLKSEARKSLGPGSPHSKAGPAAMRAEAAVALVNGGVQTEERLDVLRFEDIGLGERRLFDIKEHPP